MRKQSSQLIIVVLAAAATRLLLYNTWSFSNDELSALSRLDFDSLGKLIQHGVRTDGHPALVQVLLYYWTSIAGTSEAMVRLPFVISGIFAVVLTYLLAKKWFGKSAAMMASLTLALLEFPVLYSQLARPYSIGLLFVMTSAYLWDILLFRNRNNKWWIASLAGISYALAMYTHYFSFLAILIMGVTGLFFLNRKTYKTYLFSGVLATLLFAPHIPVTLHHLTIGGVGGWLAKPEPWWLLTHLKYVFNDSWWLMAVLMSTGIFALNRQIRENGWKKYHTLAILIFGLLFLTGFLYSFFINAVIQHSTMLFGLPFLLMFVFSGWSQIKNQKLVLGVVTILLIIPPWGISNFYGQQHFGDFKGVAKNFSEWNQLAGKHNTTNILYANDPWYIKFYMKDDSVHFDYVFHNQSGEIDSLATNPDFGSTPHALFAWTKPYRKQVVDVIRSRYPHIMKDENYGDLSRATLFSKTPGKSYDTLYRKTYKLIKHIYMDFDSLNELVETNQDSFKTLGDEPCYQADKKYNLTCKTSLKAIGTPVKEVEITGKLRAPDKLQKASVTCSMGPAKGKKKVWRNIPLRWFQKDTAQWHSFVFTPEIKSDMDANDQLTLFFWNPDKEKLFIDNLSIKLYGE